MTNLFNILFNEKPAMILLALAEKEEATYGSVISREVQCTWCHVVAILSKFEKLGIITFEIDGRVKKIMLTKDGREMVNSLKVFRDKIVEKELKGGKK